MRPWLYPISNGLTDAQRSVLNPLIPQPKRRAVGGPGKVHATFSTPRMTLEVYAHVLPGHHRAAVDRIDGLFESDDRILEGNLG